MTEAASLLVRPAAAADMAEVQAIYAHQVQSGTATFEIEIPDLAEMTRRLAEIAGRGFPFLVAEVDGRVGGYAYANLYRTREAYRFTVEDSVYIHHERRGLGLGTALLAALIKASERAGMRQMVAVIGGSDNAASIRLHESLGFSRVGLLPAVGFKLGRWCDSVLMQRPLGHGAATLPKA
jgi:phosphinothricin acetyltransferase